MFPTIEPGAATAPAGVRHTPAAIAAVLAVTAVLLAAACGDSPTGDDDPPVRMHVVSIAGQGTGDGTVTGPGGISCAIAGGTTTGSCSAELAAGSQITLNAVPTAGDAFGGWAGACQGSGACTLAVTSTASVTAQFELGRYRVTVAGAQGSGHVSGPGGLDCTIEIGTATGTCTAELDRGNVALVATPADGLVFRRWTESGAPFDPSPTLTFALSADRTLAPNFSIGRSTSDRPDPSSAPQIHVMYVLPSDGEDRELDVNGTLARSVASFHNWFIQRSNGLAFRFDTFHGELDITFHRLSLTDAQMIAFGPFVVTEIERQLMEAGRIQSDKRYIVYYDGGSNYACGGAAWPPRVPGRVAAMYLRGTPGGVQCASQQFVTSPTQFPRYWEFAMLHDLVHTLGIVAENAPGHTSAYPAHVPEPNDLMYSGPQPWILNATTTIDVAGDNYFGANVPAGVVRLTDSPFVTAPGVAVHPQLEAPHEIELLELRRALELLPPHVPFALDPGSHQ